MEDLAPTVAQPDVLLARTPLLDFDHPSITALIARRGWTGLTRYDRIGAAYAFVRDEIAFGYNRDDAIPASEVLSDGIGQCNTKATLLMALLRALDIPCRLHGFTIHKSLQQGVVPPLVYPIAPDNILHSWIELEHDGTWLDLEGFILDARYLSALQSTFGDGALCGYGAGTECLGQPEVAWKGTSTYIQRTGINADLGLWDSPDAFYARHEQAFGRLRGWLYRNLIRHWMNARVRKLRRRAA
ncbi:transglutaminase family protein [Pararhodobacter sp. CCB-MM2]|uniref:transglutaminase-like domain-containing protein n=1 Tax=Pararhodobacter sp. CCB-MM2 TaxID=1786003 RepID=UPI0008353C3B|nr:transglutaminase family protein [Pararhodobacter sp. CCB-MM2]